MEVVWWQLDLTTTDKLIPVTVFYSHFYTSQYHVNFFKTLHTDTHLSVSYDQTQASWSVATCVYYVLLYPLFLHSSALQKKGKIYETIYCNSNQIPQIWNSAMYIPQDSSKLKLYSVVYYSTKGPSTVQSPIFHKYSKASCCHDTKNKLVWSVGLTQHCRYHWV